MLLRVVAGVGAFPLHAVPILTSAVVECAEAGLAASAYDCAAALMRPEHRARIGTAHRRRVEGIVRRREWCAACGIVLTLQGVCFTDLADQEVAKGEVRS